MLSSKNFTIENKMFKINLKTKETENNKTIENTLSAFSLVKSIFDYLCINKKIPKISLDELIHQESFDFINRHYNKNEEIFLNKYESFNKEKKLFNLIVPIYFNVFDNETLIILKLKCESTLTKKNIKLKVTDTKIFNHPYNKDPDELGKIIESKVESDDYNQFVLYKFIKKEDLHSFNQMYGIKK